MEINECVRQEILDNLDDFEKSLMDVVRRFQREFRHVDTVEALMKCKKDFLREFISLIPLDGDTCYFCLDQNGYCDGCPYRDYHGKCGHEGSDWKKIYTARRQLQEALEKYYNGEIYDDYEGGVIK